MLLTWLQYRFQLSRSNASLAALPCNLSNRPLATCAHRANAAELLKLLQGSGSSSGASKMQQLGSLQEQMSALWSNGITCFDLDVVQLAGGDFVIGHPVDLAHKASRSRSSSDKKLAPEQLHKHDLAELRAAGVDAAAAPALHTVLLHFAQLQRSKPPGSNSNKSKQQGRSKLAAVSVVEAAEKRDSWQQVPLLALELKGPASVSVEAWQDVITAVNSAGVADATVLWLRQPAGAATAAAASVRRALLKDAGTAAVASISNRSSSSSSSKSVVLQLAQSLRKHTTSSSSSSKTQPNLKSLGPLLGLIVPDTLMSASASSVGAAGAPAR
jgi:hypothetical protein